MAFATNEIIPHESSISLTYVLYSKGYYHAFMLFTELSLEVDGIHKRAVRYFKTAIYRGSGIEYLECIMRRNIG